jgi:dolichol-phosphate mannosyltransferase
MAHMPAPSPTSPTLSVVVPMFNEEEALPFFAQRLRPVLDGLGCSYEVVCVDDGSRDGTARVLRGINAMWPQLRLLRLRRNAGHQAALTAGLEAARGNWVVTIDADLQDPPEAIAEMLRIATTSGADVVYGRRSDRTTDTTFKRTTAGMYYRIMERVLGVDLPEHAGDFRMLSRRAVEELHALPERNRVYRLLVPYLGLTSASVEYVRDERVAGRSKYPLRRMVRLALDSFVSFTTAPLRAATYLGVIGFVACGAFSFVALVAWLRGTVLPGWTSVAIVLGFASAMQFLLLGVLGEYVARIYVELQGRPRYFVAQEEHSREPDPAARV